MQYAAECGLDVSGGTGLDLVFQLGLLAFRGVVLRLVARKDINSFKSPKLKSRARTSDMQPFDWSSKSEMTRNTMRDTKLFGDVETRQRRCIKVTKDGRVTLSPSLGVEVQFSESRSSLLPRAHSEPVQKLMSQGDELAEGLSRAFAKVSIRDVLFGDSQDVREGEEEDALDDALDAIVTECTKRMPRTDIEALTPVRPVGIGGQGGVWLAQDPGTRMKYAVKQFSKSRLSNLTKKAALRAINERSV